MKNNIRKINGYIKTGQDEGFVLLSASIVKRTVQDYRLAKAKLEKNPNSYQDFLTVKDCERFFNSPWFKDLSHYSAEQIISLLNNSEDNDNTEF